MIVRKLMTATILMLTTAFVSPRAMGQQPPVATFKAGVDLVQISAVVRDRKGRFVENLAAHDFEVTDSGQVRTISDFRRDLAGVSVALLFDVSGSMEARLA